MIEWSWRVEDSKSILCGSWSEEGAWNDIFRSLVGRTVDDVEVVGRIPELSISLSDDRHVLSFMTAEGQPSWTAFVRRDSDQRTRVFSVESGVVIEEAEEDAP